MRSILFFLSFITLSLASCNDYYRSRAKEQAENLKRSDSLSKKLERMEDTIYMQSIVDGDTINTYRLKR